MFIVIGIAMLQTEIIEAWKVASIGQYTSPTIGLGERLTPKMHLAPWKLREVTLNRLTIE